MMSSMVRTGLFAFVCTACALPALAQSQGPVPAAPAPAIAAPRDTVYPGTITLAVDATDLARHIFRVHETVPVTGPGPLTLLYPEWIPGHHSASGPIDKFAGLVIRADGKPIAWQRDPVQVYAFHVDVPKGAKTLDLQFQFLSPVESKEGRVVMTPSMLNLQWDAMSLYPAGHYTRQITFAPSLTLPKGWKFGTALETRSVEGDTVHFKDVTYNTLVDSPLFAGRNFRRENLDPGAKTPVHMDIVADRPDELQITPQQLAPHRALVQQAYKLFGTHHYNHYDFLVSLSDKMSHIGLEHHRSSEDGTIPRYFLDWDSTAAARNLLAHEFTHSWNGKFRRPADLWTPNFNVPMRDSLLWVYEGQTQYWGYVLAARAGLVSHQDTLDAIALTAATYDHYAGRSWRALVDTTNDPIIAHRSPIPWRNWQRSEDYYSEGQLVWFDVDTLIRKLSDGKRSLDDFAKAFFGIDPGSYVTHTYTFADIVATLNKVQPYDWAKFLTARLTEHGAGAPLDGIKRGGYRLAYDATETPYQKGVEKVRKFTDFSFSLGFTVGKEGALGLVYWGGPAFKAGLTVGTKLVAVNGDAFTPQTLKDAVTWAKTHKAPIALLVEAGKQYRTVTIDYHGGLRYPHLVPIGSGPHSLDAILTAR